MVSKVWETMNDLEQITNKICSAREIIDSAADAIGKNDHIKAEVLITAAYEFLGYYLDEFDEKFKLAWKETVTKEREKMKEASTNSLNPNDIWENDEIRTNEKWILSIEEDNLNGDLFITFPNELIEQVGWRENDTLEWIDNGDESWTIKKQNQ